jgi:hypothetical protein
MKDFIKKITVQLEPLIADLPENKRILDLKKDMLENVSRFLAYVNGDVHLVGIYADQELISDSFEALNSNKEEYKASCYLLKSEDSNVKNLPQYKNAYDYIMRIINYFKEQKNSLSTEIDELNNVCKKQELEEKYYKILSSEYPLIENDEEFKEFLNNREIDNDDMINTLYYAIENNLMHYEGKRS